MSATRGTSRTAADARDDRVPLAERSPVLNYPTDPADAAPREDMPLPGHDLALVLVVDDNLELSDRLWAGFHQQGYRVGLAFTADEATEYVQSPAFQVVVIDMKLPNGDESFLYRRVRAANPRARPILITTLPARPDQLVQQVLLRAGRLACSSC